MDRETKAVAIFFALALSGFAVAFGYTAIQGLLTGKVFILSKFGSGHYSTGISGVFLAVAYLFFSVGLVFGAAGFSARKGDAYMSWFKKMAILGGIILVCSLLAHFYTKINA